MANVARQFREKALADHPQAVVHARGRHRIEHRYFDGQNYHRVQDYSIAPIHIENTEIEIDSDWVDAELSDAPFQKKMVLADYNAYFGNGNLNLNSGMPFRYVDPQTGDFINWQPQGQTLQWTNNLNQLSNVGTTVQSVQAQIIGDLLSFPSAWGSGLDFELELQTARLQKRIKVNSLASIGSPPQSIIDGGNPVLMASWLFQRSPGVTIWLDGVQWGEGNGQANARASSNYVEFRSSDGTVLWYMSPTFCWDSDGNHVTNPIRIRRAGASFIIELRISWSWLQTAIYPITIDPTIEPQIGASGYDAAEATNGVMNLTSTPLTNVDETNEWNGLVFVDLNLSNVATFDVAYLILYFTSSSLDEPDLTIYGLDTADPGIFTTTVSDISGRTKTTASVTYANTNLGAPGSFNSSSIVTIVDELYTSYSPYSSENMGFALTSRAGDTTRDTSIESYDGSTTNAAKLHIEYTESGTTITLDTATLTASGQIIDVVPGAVTKLLDTAQLTANGQAIDVVPGVATILLDTASLTASGQAIDVVPGTATITLDTATLVANGIALDVVPGQVIIPLDTAVLTATGQVITISLAGSITITLDTAQLTASGQVIDVVPGAVSIPLDTAQATLLGQIIDVVPGAVSIPLSTAQALANGQAIDVVPGSVSITLDTAQINAQGVAIDVVPGGVSIQLDTATLLAAGQTITISIGSFVVISLDTATLTATGQTLTVVPGAVSITLDTAQLLAQGRNITILLESNQVGDIIIRDYIISDVHLSDTLLGVGDVELRDYIV